MAASATPNGTLSLDNVASLSEAFGANPQNILAMNAVTRNDVDQVLVKRSVVQETNHVFSHVVENENKAADQKSSGRCWLFAACNIIRCKIIAEHDLSNDFELSQAYLHFWDKVERANYFLNTIIETVDEPTDSRVVQHLLSDPISDGGQWDMIVNLINKYGLVPKQVYPESHSSGATRKMNALLKAKLREFASQLRSLGKLEEDSFAAHAARGHALQEARAGMMEELYRIITIHLGEPPKRFTWSVASKDGKTFNRYDNLTPLKFVEDFVKVPIANMVSLVHDPRNPAGSLMTVQYLGNVVGGVPVRYINCEIDTIKEVARNQIEGGDPVWFGCDVGKFFLRDEGVLDVNLFDHELVFGTTLGMDKATRLEYGHSLMTHAMVFTGVDSRSLDVETGDTEVHVSKPTLKWRVENSWGDKKADKGYLVMSDDWFSEYVYQIVVDKDTLSEELQAVLDQEPIVLPPWDPMGSLAQN